MRGFGVALLCSFVIGCSSSSSDGAAPSASAGAGGSQGGATANGGASGSVGTSGNAGSSDATGGQASGGISGSGGVGGSGGSFVMPAWQSAERIQVPQGPKSGIDCRSGICRHNENTDLIRWNGAIWFVHRTALGQVLGPNSSLHIYRSDDEGETFTPTAVIEAPQTSINADDTMGAKGRDIRDPCFYIVGDKLFLKALTRIPSAGARDTDVDTISVAMSTSDGITWSPMTQMTVPMWSLWRIKENQGTYYAGAYEDGDASTALFTSTDGMSWTMGATIYDVAAETPLEPQVVFMPSGKMLVYMRNDGDNSEILGDTTLTTRICWADPPYATFSCPATFDGQRLDGPVDFFWQDRLFVIARKHLGTDLKKRTSLFEITGTLDGGPLDIKEWGELPSAGDTAYAGVVPRMDGTYLVTWYSSDLATDPDWVSAMAGPTDIWRGVLDLTMLQ